jgi:hypothetical protein
LAYISGPEIAGDLASLATLTSSPQVWESLDKAAKRADLNDRTSMVAGINYQKPPLGRGKLVLLFLAGLFEDSSKPASMPEQNPNIVSHTPVPASAQINNIAAKEAGFMLHAPAPEDDASQAKWAAYRKRLIPIMAKASN